MPLNSLLGPISVPLEESWIPSLQPPGPKVEFLTCTPFPPIALDPPPTIDRRPSWIECPTLPHVSPSKTRFNGAEPGETSTGPVNVTPLIVMFRTPEEKFPPDIDGDAPASAATTTIELFAPPPHDPYHPDARHPVAPPCACENIDANDDGVAWKSVALAALGSSATEAATVLTRIRPVRRRLKENQRAM